MSSADICSNFLESRRHMTISQYTGVATIATPGNGNVEYSVARVSVEDLLNAVIILRSGEETDNPKAVIINYRTRALIPGGFTFFVANLEEEESIALFVETEEGSLEPPSSHIPDLYLVGRMDRVRLTATYSSEQLTWVRGA